jgi:hypothetical protein
LAQPSSYQVGDKIEGNFGGKGVWFSGRIMKESLLASPQETERRYDLLFDDGEEESDVPVRHLRLVQRKTVTPRLDSGSAAIDTQVKTSKPPEPQKLLASGVVARQASTNLDSFLNELSDDDDDDDSNNAGFGDLDGGRAVDLKSSTKVDIVGDDIDDGDEDDYGEDFAA